MPDFNPASGELSFACEAGDLARVTELIESGHKWSQDRLNRFLCAATTTGQVAICRYLLENGAEVDTAPLSVEHLEASKAVPVLELFMRHGWKLNDAVWYGHVLLPYTLQNENLLRWLLDKGADPNVGRLPGPEPLDGSEHLEHVDISLEEKAARVDQLTEEWIRKASDEQNDSIRQIALRKMDSATFLLYQREGIDPVRLHYRNQAWRYVRKTDAPLSGQAQRRRHRGMAPYYGSGDALNVAASGSSIAIIDLLISYGAKLENSTALHHAAESNDADAERIPVMKRLLDLGVDINASDDARGNYALGTALHCAVRERKLERARLLLHEGADPHKKNQRGITPLEMVHPNWREEFVELFRGWLST